MFLNICIIPHRREETRPFLRLALDLISFYIKEKLKVVTIRFRSSLNSACIHHFYILSFRFLKNFPFSYIVKIYYVWSFKRTSTWINRRSGLRREPSRPGSRREPSRPRSQREPSRPGSRREPSRPRASTQSWSVSTYISIKKAENR